MHGTFNHFKDDINSQYSKVFGLWQNPLPYYVFLTSEKALHSEIDCILSARCLQGSSESTM